MTDKTVTITLPLHQASKLLHLYGWACDQNKETKQEWWDIYWEATNQIAEQARV